MLSVEGIKSLKRYIDGEYESVINSMKVTDSDRLIRNKVLGFVIALQDHLNQIKPDKGFDHDNEQAFYLTTSAGAHQTRFYGAQISKNILLKTDRFAKHRLSSVNRTANATTAPPPKKEVYVPQISERQSSSLQHQAHSRLTDYQVAGSDRSSLKTSQRVGGGGLILNKRRSIDLHKLNQRPMAQQHEDEKHSL